MISVQRAERPRRCTSVRAANGHRGITMIRVRTPALTALAIWILGAAPGAAIADTSGTMYTLIVPPSSLEVGCQPPCECPDVLRPTYGSFELVPAGSDPLYSYYNVERYIASFNNGPGAVAITGSGRFKIGGEFALVQQLTLDLQIEGGLTEHFDSGLKPVSAPFPRIDIACAVHGFYCIDSVLVVDATPIGSDAVPPQRQRPAGIEAVQPNPFKHTAGVVIDLDRPGIVDLTVVDLGGRRMRQLVAGQFLAAGRRTVMWDGLRDDGRAAPAGVYWVRMRWPGGMDGRRLVKLD